MDIILTGLGFKTSAPLRAYAEQRVVSWLGHLEREIETVTVQLTSRSREEGVPTECRLLARPARGECLVLQETSDDAYEAIDSASERMAKALELARRKRRRLAHAGV